MIDSTPNLLLDVAGRRFLSPVDSMPVCHELLGGTSCFWRIVTVMSVFDGLRLLGKTTPKELKTAKIEDSKNTSAKLKMPQLQ